MTLPTGVYRADHVGSFLRSAAIKKARLERASEKISADELRSVEDAEISSIVTKELEAGIRSITDGEFRRAYFHLDFLKQLDGVDVKGGYASTHQGPEGFTPPKLVVTGKLKHNQPIQVEDFHFLESAIKKDGAEARASTKVCIPSPTMVHFRGGRSSIDVTSYPNLDPDFFDDLATVYQAELDSLYKAGCRFVQLGKSFLLHNPKTPEKGNRTI